MDRAFLLCRGDKPENCSASPRRAPLLEGTSMVILFAAPVPTSVDMVKVERTPCFLSIRCERSWNLARTGQTTRRRRRKCFHTIRTINFVKKRIEISCTVSIVQQNQIRHDDTNWFDRVQGLDVWWVVDSGTIAPGVINTVHINLPLYKSKKKLRVLPPVM